MEERTIDELSSAMAATLRVTEAHTRSFLSSLTGLIKSSLLGGTGAMIPGLGTISLASPDIKKGSTFVNVEIGKGLAEKIAQSSASVDDMLKSFARIAREEISAGNRLLLDGLGAIEVSSEKPKVLEDILGNKTLKPIPPAILFIAAESLAASIAPKKIQFVAAEELRKEVVLSKSQTIHLVFPQFDFFTEVIEYHFQKGGWRVEKSTSIVDSIMKIDTGKTCAVILDASLKEQQKLCKTVKMRRETNRIPIVMIVSPDYPIDHSAGLVIHPDATVSQPFDVKQLIRVVEREIIRAFDNDKKQYQRIVCIIPSDNDKVEEVIELAQRMFEGSGLTEEGQIALSAAFREAVGNAMKHGNVMDARKKVEIECVQDNQKISIAVRDEGKGFDHSKFFRSGKTEDAVAAAREMYAHGKRGGLGIILMMKCCDKIEYGQKGNVVVLTKLINPAAK